MDESASGPLAAAGTGGSADGRPGRGRRRVVVVLAVLAALGALVAAYDYAFCNWAMHGDEWIAARIDESIRRGLYSLYAGGTFGLALPEGGESRVHHHFLELILELEEHAGLRAQMAEAARLNADEAIWRVYGGIPGWRRGGLTVEERSQVAQSVAAPTREADRLYYDQWLLHALYPRMTRLAAQEEARLFEDTGRLRTGYQLTHALLAYLWLERVAPEVASERGVERLQQEVNERLLRQQRWDPRTSDLYNERVAFWLYQGDGPAVRARWIERIIGSQNADGGWTYERSASRAVRQMVGLGGGDGRSHPHATFLAVYALVKYREQLRSAGKYPAHGAAR